MIFGALDRRFYRVIGGLGEGNGDAVLVPADAFVVDRAFEAMLVVVEAVPSSPLPLQQFVDAGVNFELRIKLLETVDDLCGLPPTEGCERRQSRCFRLSAVGDVVYLHSSH